MRVQAAMLSIPVVLQDQRIQDKMINENEEVNWVPDWAKKRFRNVRA
jgi:isoleucyl-tRNA synthetase